MYIIFAMIALCSIGALLIGMIEPARVLPVFKVKTRMKVIGVYFVIMFISMMLWEVTMPQEEWQKMEAKRWAEKQKDAKNEAKKENERRMAAIAREQRKQQETSASPSLPNAKTRDIVSISEVLKTRYFDVTVNKVYQNVSVDTGNPLVTLEQEAGNKYLIINTTFKNTDNESRMMFNGIVWIDYNGKRWKFDHSETILLDGWGMLMQTMNPLTTKTTNIVFKIPAEIKGPAYFEPGRASNGTMIFLGNL